MHEHFGKDKLGKTVVVNAGFGSYVNTILEIKSLEERLRQKHNTVRILKREKQ